MATQENVKTGTVILRADFPDGTNVVVERDGIAEALPVMASACIPTHLLVETPAPVDDEETRAFIEGWNSRVVYSSFDMALHWWNRRRAGI
jgi:hypothetical protein